MLFFRFCGCFSCSREVSRTRRNLKLALNSFENDLHCESYFRKINVKKYPKICVKWQILVLNSEKNSRLYSIFFKIHNFGTHIFLYVYTTHTQLPHMSYLGTQIHNHRKERCVNADKFGMWKFVIFWKNTYFVLFFRP